MVCRRAHHIAAAVVLLAALTACGTQNDPVTEPQTQPRVTEGRPTAGPADWQRLPRPPLTPRAWSVMVSAGPDVLVMGGQDTVPCPPGADCVPGRVRRDGAALDLTTGAWRPIAPAPRPLRGERGVVVDGVVHVLARSHGAEEYARPPRLLSYDIAADRWRESPGPENSLDAGLTSAGGRLLAYPTSHERGRVPDRILDGNTWRSLPPDPLAPSFDRVIVPVADDRWLLLARALVPNPGADEPSIVQAAEFDLATRTWRRLPDSEILGGPSWSLTDDLLVDPSTGGADGGQTGNYGRVVPYGGIFDPRARRWRPLPALPGPLTDELWRGPPVGGTELAVVHGFVLDPGAGEGGRWIRLTEPIRGAGEGRSAVWVGDRLVAFGGTVDTGGKTTFTAETWMWQP
jgi:hypothetical protein